MKKTLTQVFTQIRSKKREKSYYVTLVEQGFKYIAITANPQNLALCGNVQHNPSKVMSVIHKKFYITIFALPVRTKNFQVLQIFRLSR